MLTKRWFCAEVERAFFFFLVNISALVYCAPSTLFTSGEGADDKLFCAWGCASGCAKDSAKLGRRGNKIAACSLDNVTVPLEEVMVL